MKRQRYFVLAAVILASLAAVQLLPHGELVQTIASIPIFGSLSVIVLDILRDQAARQHATELAAAQNQFDLAASSHMASTAFDKHVAFCEEYICEVYVALGTLFREGPTKKALEHSNKLYEIKRKHGLWVTQDIEDKLCPFEKALRKIGAADFVSSQFPGSEGHQKRTSDMYRQFAEVLGSEHMGTEWEGEPITDNAAVSRVVSHLRTMLGVEELTKLRAAIVQQALTRAK